VEKKDIIIVDDSTIYLVNVDMELLAALHLANVKGGYTVEELTTLLTELTGWTVEDWRIKE
jgi:hypothetical protein